MTKRTFVLFFCLVQTLAFTLLTGQSQACYKAEIIQSDFSPHVSSPSDILLENEICEDICENEPVIRADEAEWKENLTNLLRHRHSTYRFSSFEVVPSAFLDFVPGFKIFSRFVKPFSLYKSVTILPDYYSFLHLLCPF
ncbi:hypothetical protein [Dyadobacter psychrotolerans]|uniref:Uncharacterized protein n=1 Tax=Dyadobacter psychrotolerans TaxID=2541721 RepID=A0A4R5DQY8_9BACT|nr:hypothetical protein [Dyadobacter psychrotolerans]TDE16812.1 hypothetical protein E0F88_11365 [Dyadobacter psychrotolerans]